MPAPAACLEECTDLHLVGALRARGYDVTSVQYVGPLGVDDRGVLERATSLGQGLITHNADDFRKQDAACRREDGPHGGIICLPWSRGAPFRRLELRAAMMLDWVASQPFQSYLFSWRRLQEQIERGFRLPGYTEDDVREASGRG